MIYRTGKRYRGGIISVTWTIFGCIKISRYTDREDDTVIVSEEEWPALRDAIDAAIMQKRSRQGRPDVPPAVQDQPTVSSETGPRPSDVDT